MRMNVRTAVPLLAAALAIGVALAGCGSTSQSGQTTSAAAATTAAASPVEATSTASAASPTPTPSEPDSSVATSDPSPSVATDGSEPPSSATATVAQDIDAACAALVKIDAVPQPSSDSDTPPPAAVNKQFGQAVQPLLEEALAKGDAELAESLTVLQGPVEAAASNGTPIDTEDEKIGMALAGYEAWAHSSCGFQTVDLMAVDYKYQGAPKTLKAGVTSIAMMNHSEKGEFHLALVVQPRDPKITTVKQLLAIPLPELQSSVDIFGAAQAPPGATGGVLLDLAPGRYFIVCPVAVGNKPDSMDLHMFHGMAVTFEVS